MKRFYTLVSTHKNMDGFSVRLDGRDIKTPVGEVLKTSHEKLADAIVAEWAAQEKNILPDTMPLTQILSTRIDRVGPMRDEISRQTLNYLDTDLLCYRAEKPPGLPEKQAQSWDPWLGWFEKKFGYRLQITTALQALRQPAQAHADVSRLVQQYDDDRFTVLQLITAATGSLVLALAFTEGELEVQTAFAAAHVEENFKADLYNEALHGPDPAQEKKQKALRRDLEAAQKYLTLLNCP